MQGKVRREGLDWDSKTERLIVKTDRYRQTNGEDDR